MSRHEAGDLEGLGYLLPEDSQFRLARLSNHIKFLARLAQPRIANEALEYAPEVSMGELTFCLEMLADQLDLVLDDVSWPAQGMAADAPEPDVAPMAGLEAGDTNTDRFAYGITLDQVEMLGRLIQTISAHADVVAGSDTAGVADRSLSLLGYAIHDGAIAMRGLLVQVQAQRLGQGARPRSGVGEERGVYAVGPVSLAAAGQAGCSPARGFPSAPNRRALRRMDSSVRKSGPANIANRCLPAPRHSSLAHPSRDNYVARVERGETRGLPVRNE